MVRQAVKTAKPGEWIIGRGWNNNLWKENREPVKQDLDDIIGGHLFGLSLKGENDAVAKHIKADGFSSSKNLIDETTIRAIMDKGYEYHVWTVDDARTAKRFKQWGTKSITTNVPGSMRESLLPVVDQD